MAPPSDGRKATRLDALLGLLALIGVLAGALVGIGVYVHSNRGTSDLGQGREDAVVAARQLIINLDSISATTIDQDFEKVDNGATGDFKKQFATIQATLRELVATRKTKSNSDILSAGVVTSTSTTATVLVAEDRTISDATTTKPAVQHQRWQVTLKKVDGFWLVSALANVI